MANNVKRLALIFLLLCCGRAWAGTFTATSCAQSAVNAVINGPTHTAVDGDIIQVPAGSCTWTMGVTVPPGVGITIIGAGTPNSGAGTTAANSSCTGTQITDGQSTVALITTTPTYGNSVTRVSCIDWIPTQNTVSPLVFAGTCASGGCPQLRLDNNTASGWGNFTVTSDNSFAVITGMYGVADLNTLSDIATASS